MRALLLLRHHCSLSVAHGPRLRYHANHSAVVNFIQRPLPKHSTTGALPPGTDRSNGVPGALGMGQRASTALTTCKYTEFEGSHELTDLPKSISSGLMSCLWLALSLRISTWADSTLSLPQSPWRSLGISFLLSQQSPRSFPVPVELLLASVSGWLSWALVPVVSSGLLFQMPGLLSLIDETNLCEDQTSLL